MTEPTIQEPRITVFSASDVRSYDSFTDRDSLEKALGAYDTLLLRRDGRDVVAASAGASHEALYAAFAEAQSSAAATDFMFFPGPAQLSKVASLAREKNLQPAAADSNCR
jgi:hypothetical protein